MAGLAVAFVVLAFGIFVADPILVAVLVLPGSILIQRVGGASTNLSVADLLVFVGALVCLFHVDWSRARHLQAVPAGDRLVPGRPPPGRRGPPVPGRRHRVVPPVLLPGREHARRLGHRLPRSGPPGVPALPVGSGGPRPAGHRALDHPPLPARPVGRVPEERRSAPSCGSPSSSPSSTRRGSAINKVEARIIEVLCLLGLLASQSRQSGDPAGAGPRDGAPAQLRRAGPLKTDHLHRRARRGARVLQLRPGLPEQPAVQLGGHPVRPDRRGHPRLAREPGASGSGCASTTCRSTSP